VAFQGPKATSKSRMFIWASGFHNLEAGLKSESNSVPFARTREFRLTCSHAVKRLLCAKAPCSIRCYVLGPVSLWNSPCALKSRNLGSFMQRPTSPPFPNGRHRSQSCRRQSPLSSCVRAIAPSTTLSPAVAASAVPRCLPRRRSLLRSCSGAGAPVHV
jgi:hypothetical protein